MNKVISNKQLKEAFDNIPLESLPSGFMENLMSKIEKESVRRKRKKVLIASLQIVAGIASMLLFPVLGIYLCNIFISGFSFSFSDMDIDVDPNVVVIGLAVLFLLIIDALCRKYMTNKQL
jgi:hypothetical protein